MLRLLALPQGMLLVTGPTGSGKSTTLYAALNVLRKPSVNIITVEDPVEYVLPGINQVHVNVRAGLTFASCLRSILRQDPNVIMLGEIRDRETAEIAMKAAQTGHLVLSTLHTNDSISAIVRLLDLEIPGYLMAASLAGIMAQRLIRKLCICRTEAGASAAFRTRLAEMGIVEPVQTEWTPGSCELCGRTGFRGRVGVYELLVVDEAVRAAIREGCQIKAIRHAAGARGFKLMQEDAFEKVRTGITTMDEVLRIVPLEAVGMATECGSCGRTLGPAFQFCPFCGASRLAESAGPKEGTDGGGTDRTRQGAAMKTGRKAGGVKRSRAAVRFPHLRELSLSYEGRNEDIWVRPPDISVRGMFINTATRFPEGSVLKVRFRLTRSGVEISTRSEVRYCLVGVGVGVEFLDLSPQGAQAIEKEILLNSAG